MSSCVHGTPRPRVGKWITFKTTDGKEVYGRVGQIENPSSFRHYTAILENGARFSPDAGHVLTWISDEKSGALELRRAYSTYEEQMKAAADAHGKTLCEVAERHAHERHAVDQLHQDDLEKARIAHEADLQRFGKAQREYREKLERHLYWTRAALIGCLLALGVGVSVLAAGPERLQAWATSLTQRS
jgi:hypothetical protein